MKLRHPRLSLYMKMMTSTCRVRERELACMKCNLSGYLLLFHTFTLGAFPYLRVHIFVRSLYNQPQRTRQREQRVTVRI